MIRPARLSDAERIAQIYAVYVRDTVISFEAEPPSADEFRARMSKSVAWLVAEEDGVVVGYAYASRHRERQAYRWSVDVSVYLDGAAQRRGLGRALYAELFDLLRSLGYVNAFAGVTLPNPKSEGLHASMGFSPVGIYRGVGYKFGAWHDVLWSHLRLRLPPDRPEEPGTQVPGEDPQ